MSTDILLQAESDIVTVSCGISFGVTKTAYEALCSNGKDPNEFLQRLSGAKILIFTLDWGRPKLFTDNGVFQCAFRDPEGEITDNITLIGFAEKSFMDQNLALTRGILISPERGIHVEFTHTDYGRSAWRNGEEYFDEESKKDASAFMDKDTITTIEKHLKKFKKNIEKIEKKTERRLDLAASYATMTNSLEKERKHQAGRLFYRDIQAVHYDRLDRQAYKFITDPLGEEAANAYKEGVQVQVSELGESKTAEIYEVDKDEGWLTLLFNRQLNLSNLEKQGYLELSISEVCMDVQLDAVEKLRNGTAAAKYINHVFGKRSTLGFTEQDLSSWERQLREDAESPKNESQIQAILSGVRAKDILLVMGPPGTGKTTVILEWVRHFVRQEEKRVLISSQNNKAVDNVLERMTGEDGINIIRIGSEAKVQDNVKRYLFERKLENLRKDIETSVTANLFHLNRLEKTWSDIIHRVELLVIAFDTQAEHGIAFRREAPTRLMAPRAHFFRAREKERSVKEEIAYTEQECQRLNERKNEYARKSVGWATVPYWLGKQWIRFTHARKQRKLKQLNELGILCHEEHCAARNNYKASREEFRKEIFLPYAASRVMRRQRQQEVLHALGVLDFGFFSALRTEEARQSIQSPAQVKSYRESAARELQRLKNVRALVSEWKADGLSQQNYTLKNLLLKSVNLVGATCIGINSQKRFADLDFDVTIIDEAGQIQLHNALVPMSVSNKLIMLGDHKQIPPMTEEAMLSACKAHGIETELLEKSLFEKLYEELPAENKIMLDTQYRMPAEIADTLSKWFYDGKYLSYEGKKALPGKLPFLSQKPYIIIDTSDAGAQRFEESTGKNGAQNAYEAKIIISILKAMICIPGYLDGLLSSKKEDEREKLQEVIGIISAYKRQIQYIREEIKTVFDDPDAPNMAATLDSFQGQERKLIFYSFTRSANKAPQRPRIGFMKELRRLNVAMSRCKQTLVLIGDMEFLSSCMYVEPVEDESDEANAYEYSEKRFSEFMRQLLQDVDAGSGERMSSQVFFQKMKELGVHVEE